MSTTIQPVDQAKLDEFMGRFVGDLGAALSAALVVIGDRLGLYRAMADGEPVGPDELAERTGTDPRYVREWLSNQAASGYVNYDPGAGTFSLSPEQAFALAQEDSPAFVPGAFQVATAAIKDEEKIGRAFVGRHGVGWHEHHRRPVQRHRALLPSRVRGQPRVVVDPGARRGRRTDCKPGRAWPTSAAGTARRRS